MTSEDLIVGIDLGTTNSLVGVVESGFPILLADENGRRIVPSVVHYPADGSPALVGEPAQRRHALAPDRTIASVKRLMGRRIEELSATEKDALDSTVVAGPGQWAEIALEANRHLRPEEVSAEILRRLKAVAEAALEQPVTRAVITVPAYFNDAQRQATVRAGELAGLTVERIVNEPTAAALAYGLGHTGASSRVAVYDFGGGTFDLSLLQIQDGVFTVIATNGDTRLGGDDLDQALAGWLLRQSGLTAAPGLTAQVRLLEASRTAKEALSSEDSTVVRLPFLEEGRSLECTVTRADFETLARPIVERTRRHCLRALSDAGIQDPATELDAVVLVGGSTRIPLVRRVVAEIFGQEPDTSQPPEEAVALGAAVQAGILCGRVRQVLLMDVTPLSLGIETFGGLMNVIIPRNTTIPAKAGEMFTNAMTDQPAMLIRVLQGERELAKDNWELGRFDIDFPPGPKGSARVGVQFNIDANGILTVLARDTATMTDRILEIRDAAVDVDDERVEAMIAESIDHAWEDMTERQWTEARLKSDELIPAVRQALESIGPDLPAPERDGILTALLAVEAAAAAEPHDLPRLKQANQALDEATEGLAARLVEKALDDAFGGP